MFSLKNIVNVIIFSAIIHQLNIAIKGRLKDIKKRSDKKLLNLRRKDNRPFSKDGFSKFPKNAVHDFLSYALSEEEQITLSFRLQQHIPPNTN